jgi:hypothetical protein
VPKTTHSADALTPDVGCKQWTEKIQSLPHRLMANVDTTLEQQLLNIQQRGRKSDVFEDNQSDCLRR